MRKIISISLPIRYASFLKQEAKQKNIITSEYIRVALRDRWKEYTPCVCCGK